MCCCFCSIVVSLDMICVVFHCILVEVTLVGYGFWLRLCLLIVLLGIVLCVFIGVLCYLGCTVASACGWELLLFLVL